MFDGTKCNPFLSFEVIYQTHCFSSVQNAFCTLLGCYAPYSGNLLSMFRDNLSVSASRVKKSKILWPPKMEPIDYSEMSACIYHYKLRNNPEGIRSHLHRCGSLKSSTVYKKVCCLGKCSVIFPCKYNRIRRNHIFITWLFW